MTPGSGFGSNTARGISALSPCEFGMTMKITSRTSRISINGTTFTSRTVPEPLSAIPMGHLAYHFACEEDPSHHLRELKTPGVELLLPGFELSRDQTHFVDARAAHDVNRMSDFGKQYIVIAFDESNFLRTVLEDLLDTRPEAIPSGILVVDLDLAVRKHLHHDSLVLDVHVLLLVGIGLWHQRIQTFRR